MLYYTETKNGLDLHSHRFSHLKTQQMLNKSIPRFFFLSNKWIEVCFRTQYQFWKKRVEWLRFPQLWPVRFCGFFQWKTERMLWNALLLFYYWIAISEWSEWLWDEISKTLDSYSRLYVQLFRKQSQIGGKFSMKYGPEKHWELNIDSTVVSKLAMKSQFFLVKSKRILWKTFFHFFI